MTKVIDPWGSALVEDYTKIIDDFGLESFDSKSFPKPNRLMRRGVVFSGRNLKAISDSIKNKKPFYVLSGIMPSDERIHLGNKMVIENMKYFQEHGAKTFILIADLESAATRAVSLEDAKKRALNFHIPAYIALGLDPKKTVFYFQSQNREVMHKAYEFAKKVTMNEFRAIYGYIDPGRIMGALTQAADILFPQFEKRMPGIIPIGVDQDPHIRLTRDIVNRTKKDKYFSPSSIYHKYTPSLDGDLKMSKSKPESCLSLPEDIKTAKKRIMKAKTGGRESVDEQRKKGGQPEKCMIFELYKQHLIKNDKELDQIYHDCKSGKLSCKEDKQHACKLIKEFMEHLTDKIEKTRKKVSNLNFIKG